jgi:drug/metabolite transporter (DMT)-like permease
MAQVRLTHTQAVFLMVGVTVLWSTAGVVSRVLESAGRFEVTFYRSAFTVLSLMWMLPLWRAWSRRQAPQTTAITPSTRSAWGETLHRHWGFLPESRTFWLSGVCWSVMFTAFMLALGFTSVANVLILMALGPLLTALLARVVLGQRLANRTWLTIVVAALGIVYMYGSQFWSAMADPQTPIGDLLIGSGLALCVPLAGAINWTAVQRVQHKGERIDLVPAVLLGAILSSLFTLPLALPGTASASDVAWLAMLGWLQLSVPCTLSMVCAQVLKAAEVSLLGLLEVIFGIALTWAFVNEVPSTEVLVGGGLVILALVLNEALGWRERQTSA